jgi:hypothetical protein
MNAKMKNAGERLDIHNGAYLRESAAGMVFLCFRGLEYAADDTVPLSIYGDRPSFEHQRADSFVRVCMRHSHGDGEEAWPGLALRFLSQSVPTPG